VLLFAAALLVVSACSPAPPAPPAPTVPPTPAPPPASVASPDYGLHVFVWGHPQTTDRDMKLTSDVGARWQKSLFEWRLIEKDAKGQFDWREADRVVKASNAAGLKIIARLDYEPDWARQDHAPNGPPDNYQDYWDFVSAFVKRYSATSDVGRVAAIEVWNEPNLDREWGNQPISRQSAADYLRLLAGAYRAAKAADASVTVLSAGLSPTGVTDQHSADDLEYLGWLYEAGLKGGVNYDALGAHANTQASDVSSAPGSLPEFTHPSFYFRRVEQLRDLQVKNGDGDRQIWLLEFGWTSDSVHAQYKWFAVSETKKAQNIVSAFLYARQHWSPWIGVMSLWNLPDPNWTPDDEQFWWGITTPDGTPREAYTRLKEARANGRLS
jgi:hypothetical protein